MEQLTIEQKEMLEAGTKVVQDHIQNFPSSSIVDMGLSIYIRGMEDALNILRAKEEARKVIGELSECKS